jgi:hypothetical protein
LWSGAGGETYPGYRRLPAFRTCQAISPWRGFCGTTSSAVGILPCRGFCGSRYSRVRVGPGFTTVRPYDIGHCPKPLRGAEICQKRCGNSFQPTPAPRCRGRTILKTGSSHSHFAVKGDQFVPLGASSAPCEVENPGVARGWGSSCCAPKLTQWRLSEVEQRTETRRGTTHRRERDTRVLPHMYGWTML